MDRHRLTVRLAPPGRAHGQHAPPGSLLARQHASGTGEEAASRNMFPLWSHLLPEPNALHAVLQFAQLDSSHALVSQSSTSDSASYLHLQALKENNEPF